MCGICFYWLKGDAKRMAQVYQSFSNIYGRGPDNSSFHKYPNYCIGFHRLSIMDPGEAGDQPFVYVNEETKNRYKLI